MGTVLNVEVITHRAAVGSDDGRAAAQNRADRPRDQAIPVEVSAAVEVPAARDGDGELVGSGVRRRDEVGVERRRLSVVASVDMKRALEHACSRLRHRLGNVELRSDGPNAKRNVEQKWRRSGVNTTGRDRRQRSNNTNRNRLPVSFDRRNLLWNSDPMLKSWPNE